MSPRSTTPAPVARHALLAGASGLVGGQLLRALLATDDYGRVTALTRRPLALDNVRLANRIVSFDQLPRQLKGFTCDDAFCCLGTTLRAAGSPAAFRAVDLDLVVAFAAAARAAGAGRMVLVSSVGADPGAGNLYLRVKGEAEQAVGALGFAALDILQPGLLLGARREIRPLELAGRLVMPLLNPLLMGRLAMFRAIPAATVALAARNATRSGRHGIHVYAGAALRALAARP